MPLKKLKQEEEERKYIPQAKPLLFLIDGGTVGDKKPLALLAIIAAAVSVLPVTLPLITSEKWHSFISKYAKFKLGDNWNEKLHLLYFKDMYQQFHFFDNLKESYFTISTTQILESLSGYSLFIDFGDNTSSNRFTSKLIAYKPKSNYFGSLYLDFDFASKLIYGDLNTFILENRTKNRKILLLAGSMSIPFLFDDITNWLKTSSSSLSWAIILLGYQAMTIPQEFYDRLFLIQEYIEYESIVPLCDFVISNCGAGSITIPLAYGIPQMCASFRPVTGSDKYYNNRLITEIFKLGPITRSRQFNEVMYEIQANLTLFQNHSRHYILKMRQEHKKQIENLGLFFEKLSSDVLFQEQIQKSGKIPIEFSI